jgi:hypothetical protein
LLPQRIEGLTRNKLAARGVGHSQSPHEGNHEKTANPELPAHGLTRGGQFGLSPLAFMKSRIACLVASLAASVRAMFAGRAFTSVSLLPFSPCGQNSQAVFSS